MMMLVFCLFISGCISEELYTLGCTDDERELIQVAIDKANLHFVDADLVLMDETKRDFGLGMDVITCRHEKGGDPCHKGATGCTNKFTNDMWIRSWRFEGKNDIFLSVVMHEIGHYMGREHSSNKDNVMYGKTMRNPPVTEY